MISNNLDGKLAASLEFLINFDERLKNTSVPFVIPDFILLSCELHHFKFKVLYLVIL